VKSLEVAGLFPDFYFSAIGVHPSNILKTDLDAAEAFISENLTRCVALGEVGLDYAYDFARSKDIRAVMRGLLERLIELAVDVGVPASVHSRSAYKDTLEIVVASGVEAVFHWYDGPIPVLRELLDAGFYVSATPAVEYSKGARAVMLEAPLERILVETDSPVFLRGLGRESSPVDVVGVVDALAELKGLESSEVARVTTRNTERLFGI
jgi:TatD DNase family protein